MPRLSIKSRITRSIALRKGEVALRADFASMGSASQISRALQELLKEGRLIRLGYGVYAKAKISTLSGKPVARAPLEALAQEALIRLHVEAAPGNAQRMYAEGKTTQIPMQTTFNTGNRRISRKLTVGSRVTHYENNYSSRA